MDNSPFSPFVARHRTVKDFKRRQSQLPSDLIDWDAPEIPELEKQRIIYEQIIQECNEDHAIESLINEEIFMVAHEVMIETSRKQYEEASLKDRSQINLVLGQLKLLESHCQELESQNKEMEDRNRDLESEKQKLEQQNAEFGQQCQVQSKLETVIQELESQNKDMEERIRNLQEEKLKLEEQMTAFRQQCSKLESVNQELENQNKVLEEHYRDLEFHKQELEAEISCQLDTLILRKSEVDDLRKKLDGALCRLAYHKKLANLVTK